MLILTEGAVSNRVGDFKMCCEIFDGNDESLVQTARDRWKTYKDAGHDLAYFQQDETGKWVKK